MTGQTVGILKPRFLHRKGGNCRLFSASLKPDV
jgi:hypothetical protein